MSTTQTARKPRPPRPKPTPASRLAAFEMTVTRAIAKGAALLPRVNDFTDDVQEGIAEAFNALLTTQTALRRLRMGARRG